jgi:hypothetical protein
VSEGGVKLTDWPGAGWKILRSGEVVLREGGLDQEELERHGDF